MERIEVSDEQLKKLLEFKELGLATIDIKPKNDEYKLASLDDVKLHEYVVINPPHDDKESMDLLESIAKNGQIEPVKIWEKRGTKFIIDGRHRYLVLKALGAEFIKYVSIPSNTKKDELKTLVIESETGRQMTPAQNAIRAWKDYSVNHNVTKMSMRNYASTYHTSASMLSRCKTISEALGSNVLDDMFNYKTVEIAGSRYKSLNQVVSHIEKMKSVKPPTYNVPESVSNIAPMIDALKNNNDIVGLSFLKTKISRFINDLNNED